jgi:preprotein translocase subunit YajC
MAETIFLLAQASGQRDGNPMFLLLQMALVFGIFYVILFLPMRKKQKKLESLIKELKAGDKVIINPGIFAVIVAVEDDTLQVRIDEKTKIRVLKTAVAGPQPAPVAEKEKK